MLTYLIDGNNVIHANPDWEKTFNENPENAKNYLIQKVVDFFRDTKNQATIFFDGFTFVHSFSKISNNVSIKHSKNKTADETILITIEKSKNRKNLVVVTNDVPLSSKAKLYQCRIISANDFIKNLTTPKKSSSDKPEQLSKSEIEYWLRLFNEGKEDF